MTEEEAKTKWCPMLRITNDDTGDWKSFRNNRGKAGDNLNHTCIGSACMAWRATDNEYAPHNGIGPEPEAKPAGYCGLAGKP